MRWIFLNGHSLVGASGTVKIPSGGLCTLAAMLVLNHGRPVGRDRIEETLWGEASPEKARDRLNTMLWRLRKLLQNAGVQGHTITNGRDALTYTAPEPFDCDVIALGDMARSVLRNNLTTADEADAALACIDDCNTEFLPFAQDHWSLVTRESLRSAHLTIIEALLRYMRKQERWARVSELAERLLQLEPTLETGHLELIELHGQRHQFSAAKRQYDVMQKLVDPGATLETASALDALKIARKARKSTVVMRPSIKAVESAIDHIETARDTLLGKA